MSTGSGDAAEDQDPLIIEQRFDLAAPGELDPERPRSPIRGRVTWPAEPSAAGVSSGPAQGQDGLPWVLVLHGFKGFMDWGFFPLLARRMAQGGMACVAFNTSGSGIGPDLQAFTELESFAHASISRQLEDVRLVAQQAESGGLGLPIRLDPARGGVFGHSRGGGAALLHASERPNCRALVTWAALDDFDRWDGPTKELWRRLGVLPLTNARTQQEMPIDVSVLDDYERNPGAHDILAACARVTAPTLLIHGDEDETVEPAARERIGRALPGGLGQHVPIPGAGHAFGAKHPLDGVPASLEQALGQTLDWFRAHLLNAGPDQSPGESVTTPPAGRT